MEKKLKRLELFAGSRSFSKIAEEYEIKTYTTDIEPLEKIDQVMPSYLRTHKIS